MPEPENKRLYNLVKSQADSIYKKPSAYKSGYIVKKYKQLGGKYISDNKSKNLKRWFNEKWQDVGHKAYPVYRPSVRVNKKTPLLAKEIDPKNLRSQILKKQIIKGKHNLAPFRKKSKLITRKKSKRITIKKHSSTKRKKSKLIITRKKHISTKRKSLNALVEKNTLVPKEKSLNVLLENKRIYILSTKI